MRPFTWTAAVLLATAANATQFRSLKYTHNHLNIRQSTAFQPGTSSGSGDTCSDAFGTGYVSCGSGEDCYNPTAGESCCQSSNDTYPCPSDSFCLIDGYCCPGSETAAACAQANNVTLPANYSSNSTANSTASIRPSLSANATTTQTVLGNPTVTTIETISTCPPDEASTSTSTQTAVVTEAAGTTASSTGVISGEDYTSTSSSGYAEYTGAASKEYLESTIAAIGFVGAAFLFF